MRRIGIVSGLTVLALAGFMSQALAQSKGPPKGQAAPPPAEADVDQPTFTAIEVPGLLLASNPNLEVQSIQINVNAEKVTYTYRINNKGSADVRVAAVFSLPELSPPAEEDVTYRIGPGTNPIALTLTADGNPISAKIEMRAMVLGVDRVEDLKAAKIPLVPFDSEAERAVMALTGDARDRLVNLGVVTPPSTDGDPPLPDWSLTVEHNWEQTFPAGKSTMLVATFTPITGSYAIDSDNISDLDDVQEEVCLPAPALRNLKQKIKGRVSVDVTDIQLSNSGPARWLDKPVVNITVEKSGADVIAAFCGNEKNATPNRITAKIDDEEGGGIRILLISAPK
jgi:hypothetical protein